MSRESIEYLKHLAAEAEAHATEARRNIDYINMLLWHAARLRKAAEDLEDWMAE